MSLAVGSLVLYKQRPARVSQGGDKPTVQEADGRSRSVRAKDLRLLHPGPIQALDGLERQPTALQETRELLQEEAVPFAEFVELCFGTYAPGEAWSAWRLLFEGLHFQEIDGLVRSRPADEVAALEAARAERAAQAARWEAFKQRVASGSCDREADADYIAAVERVAYGEQERCGVLADLGQNQDPVSAHALLLRIGAWDMHHDPHPRRQGVELRSPALPVPALRDSRRVDRTGQPAWAIDDAGNQDPDDAIGWDGDRIWVHIADVCALVQADDELDREARARGATLYVPEATVSMLPEACTPLLGMGLQERSPALSIGFRVDEQGLCCDPLVERSWVRVRRCSYAEADTLLDGALAPLRALLTPLRQARLQRARAWVDLPEVQIRLVDGQVQLQPIHRGPARDLVTEAMLQAGAALAEWAAPLELPLPYAAQPDPATGPPPADAGLAAQFAHMRSLSPSSVSVQPAPHAGLGLERYVRVTSPLRRYGDLLAHQQIDAHLRGLAPLPPDELGVRLALAQAAGLQVRRAERAANRHWTLVAVRQQGFRGEAVVVEAGERRSTVLVPALAFQCSMRLQGLAPDTCVQVESAGIDLPRLELRLRRLA